MQKTPETWVWSLGREDPLKEEMATYSSVLAWRIPWTEEPGELQSMGLQIPTRLSTHPPHTHAHIHLNETPCRWVCCAELLGRRDRSHQDHEVGAFFLKELGRCSSKHPCTPLCQPLPLSDPFLLQESSSWGNIYYFTHYCHSPFFLL